MRKRKETDKSKPVVPNRLLHSKAEAAALLCISLRSVHHLVASGELSTRQIGRRSLIPATALVEFAAVDHVAITPPSKPKKTTSKAAEAIRVQSSTKRTARPAVQ